MKNKWSRSKKSNIIWYREFGRSTIGCMDEAPHWLLVSFIERYSNAGGQINASMAQTAESRLYGDLFGTDTILIIRRCDRCASQLSPSRCFRPAFAATRSFYFPPEFLLFPAPQNKYIFT